MSSTAMIVIVSTTLTAMERIEYRLTCSDSARHDRRLDGSEDAEHRYRNAEEFLRRRGERPHELRQHRDRVQEDNDARDELEPRSVDHW